MLAKGGNVVITRTSFPGIFLSLLFCLGLYGQPYQIKSYSVEEGLPQSQVLSLFQDSKGYLWVGTNGEGLGRYNGQLFKHIRSKDGLCSNRITAIFEDRQGLLWFGSQDGGISCYKNNRFYTYNRDSGLISNTIWTIAEGDSGSLWFGTDKGIIKYHQGQFQNYTRKYGLLNEDVRAIVHDTAGAIWVGTFGGGVFKFDGQFFSSLLNDVEIDERRVTSIVSAADNSMWIGTLGGGLFHYTSKGLRQYHARDGIHSNSIRSLFRDKEGQIWVGTTNQGLYLLPESGEGTVRKIDGLSNNYILSITSDREGNIWAGTSGGGINRLTQGCFEQYALEDGLSSNLVISVYQDSKDQVWIGTVDKGFSRISGGKVRNYDKTHGLHNSRIWSVLEDHKKQVWISTSAGITRFDGDKFMPHNYQVGAPGRTVYQLLEDRNNQLWLASRTGLCLFEGNDFVCFDKADGLPSEVVYRIVEDDSGKLWMATKGGVAVYDGRKIRQLHLPDSLREYNTYSLEIDADQQIWIGTYGGGLVRYGYDEDPLAGDFQVYREQSGLIDNKITLLNAADSAALWIGTNKGLCKLKLDALYQEGRVIFDRYTENEGFTGIECNQNATFRDKDGNIWFGSIKGAFKYVEDWDLNRAYQTQTHIVDIKVNYKDIDWMAHASHIDPVSRLPVDLKLPYEKRHVTFEIIGINLTAPQEVTYRYKLEGYDRDWSPVTKETSLTYVNLPAGTYSLQVKSGLYNNWNELPTSYSFTILKPFWMTWWFFSLAALLVLFSIWFFINIKTKFLTRQQKLLKEIIDLRNEELWKQQILQERLHQKSIELFDSNKQISLILESLPVITFKADVDGKSAITYINNSVGKITGYKRKQFLSNPTFWYERIHPDDLEYVDASLQKLYRENSADYEYRWRVKDGSYKWFRDVVRIVENLDGKREQIGTWEDITERKLVEEEKQMLSMVASKTNNFVQISDDQDKIIWVNDGFTKIVGYTLDEVYQRDVKEVLRGEATDPGIDDIINEGIRNKESFYFEILNYNKHNKPIWLYLNVTPITNKKGEIEKFITIGSEITKQKTAEEALKKSNLDLDKRVKERTRELLDANKMMKLEVAMHSRSEKILRQSEERYRMLIEQSVEAIIMMDPVKKNVMQANQAFYDFLGIKKKPEKTSFSSPSDLNYYDFAKLSDSQIDKLIERILNAGKTLVDEQVWQRSDQSLIHVEIYANKIRQGSKDIVYLIARNTTEEREKEITDKTERRIAKSVESASNMPELYHEIHLAIQDIMPAENLYFAVYDSESNIISFPFIRDEVEENADFSYHQLENSLTAYIIKHKKPLLATEEVHKELARKGKVELVGTPSKVWMGIPLISRDMVKGAIVLQNYDDNKTYTEREMNILNQLSMPILNAIERKRFQIQQDIAFMIARAVNEIPNLDELYAMIDEKLNTVIDTRNFFIALYKKEEELLTFPYFKDEIKASIPAYKPRKLRKGFTEWVIRNGEPFFGHPKLIRELIDKGEVEQIGEFPVFWLGAPLKFHDEVIGVIVVQSYSSYTLLSQNDLQLMEFISDQIAVAIKRKQSEDQIRESNEKYSMLIETMNESIVYTQTNGNIEYFNDKFMELTGYSYGELIGQDSFSLMLDAPQLKLMKRRNQLKKKGHYELYLRRKNQDAIWVLISATPVFNKRKEMIGNLAILTDITQRKRAEEALTKSELKYRTLVETMNEGLIQVDQDDVIQYVNKRFCSMVGYSEKALLGKVAYNLFFKVGTQTLLGDRTTRGKLKINKDSSYELELTIRSGDRIWVYISVTRVFDEAGNFEGATGIVTDVTERVKVEEQLRERNNELNTFMYKASHDLKGPLASTLGLINIAKLEIKDQVALRYMQMIKKGASRLDTIIHDLLQLTRIKQGSTFIEIIDFEDLISDVLRSLENLPGYNDIDFQLKIDQKHEYYNDIKFMTSIIQNLIENAIKYSKPTAKHKVVKINVAGRNGTTLVKISDNGIGVEKKLQENIFDMFFRGTEVSKGSGLGLFIVKNAVEKLKGNISIESEKGKGTTFTLNLPNNVPA